MHVDAGEHFWLSLRPVGVELYDAVLDRLAALFQDVDDIIGRTAAGADQHQFHRARPRRLAFRAERGSQYDLMTAAGLADEGTLLHPFYACFHRTRPSPYVVDR